MGTYENKDYSSSFVSDGIDEENYRESGITNLGK